MPKVQWTGLPPALRDHLIERLRERSRNRRPGKYLLAFPPRPEQRHLVAPDLGIVGNERETFGLCLRNEDPIERVPVVRRERAKRVGVADGQRQLGDSRFGKSLGETLEGEFELPEGALDGDFPGRGRACEYLIGGRLNRSPHGNRQFRRVRERPYERLGVEEQSHRRPSNSASSSSGSGALKSRDIRTLPLSVPSLRRGPTGGA